MSVSFEKRGLLAEFEKHARRLRPARTADERDDGALAEIARFVEAQRDRHKTVVRSRGEQSSHRSRSPLDADLAYERVGRVVYLIAAIAAVAVSGLVVASVFWREAPPETAAIKSEAEPAERQPERQARGRVLAPNVSVLDPSPMAPIPTPPVGGAELPNGMSQPHVIAPPAGASRDDQVPEAPSSPPPPDSAARDSASGAAARMETAQNPVAATSGALGDNALALGDLVQRPRLSFSDAPPMDSSSSSPASDDTEVKKEIKPRQDEYVAKCFVKVDGRVHANGSCRVLRTEGRKVTFELAGKPVTISFDHGRTWLATLGSRELGKVYRRGSCWASRQVYICENGA